MILVIDIGNTNVKMGVFKGNELIKSWRMHSDAQRTGDEYGISLKQAFQEEGIRSADIEGSILSSVIPQMNYTIEHMLNYYTGTKPLMVSPGVKTGLNIKYDNARELGSDRIITSVAAVKKYGAPVIVVDFGTATTFNAVNERKEFLGGCIVPGIKTAVDALTAKAAKLPRVEFQKPKTVICRSTIANIQSGLINGTIGTVNYILRLMKREMGSESVKVVATGGLAELVKDETDIDVVDRTLSLYGLKYLYDLNTPQE